ncbi:hypothetical protein L202_07716 [Cryptococcus amylolentus CBS 6039]|uniref:Uncharacterized protein n=1 Tax=Cryptococcus amylolentus CBS 6039 TaxID=1295533 RepID=A0A1E3H9Y7_9TREE|nr:hypothetical protein L202_07716 [Cryptococcus amylolentus CBS 6039]ODN73149.1 hypothetical protein L202_07716 [Cryptococcus amylolentus CBS 6039]
MPNSRQNEITSELIITKILLEGSLPALSCGGSRNAGEPYWSFLERRVDLPIIETRYSLRSFRGEEKGERGEKVPVPPEVEAVVNEFLSSADHPESSVAQWGDPVEKYREHTQQVHISELDLLSDVIECAYTVQEPRPITYRVHSTVKDFLDDGGTLLGPHDRPMDQMEYEDKLKRAIASAKGVDGLCAELPGTIKLAFTTNVGQPTRLERSAAFSGDGQDGEVMGPKVLDPEISVSSRVMDDCPEWVHRNKAAQVSYSQSFFKALYNAASTDVTIELGPRTSAEDFMVDTKCYEQGMFNQAAYQTTREISSLQGDGVEREDGQALDGHSVKAAWVDDPMFRVLSGRPTRDRRYHSQRSLTYQDSIEEGLETMRRA